MALECIPPSQVDALKAADEGMSINSFDFSGYSECFAAIWSCAQTPEDVCSHNIADLETGRPIKLGPDAVIAAGYAYHLKDNWPAHKVVIHQTLNDKWLRWLTLKHCVFDRAAGRLTMLRRPECCLTCALEHTASLQGNWSLIL